MSLHMKMGVCVCDFISHEMFSFPDQITIRLSTQSLSYKDWDWRFESELLINHWWSRVLCPNILMTDSLLRHIECSSTVEKRFRWTGSVTQAQSVTQIYIYTHTYIHVVNIWRTFGSLINEVLWHLQETGSSHKPTNDKNGGAMLVTPLSKGRGFSLRSVVVVRLDGS